MGYERSRVAQKTHRPLADKQGNLVGIGGDMVFKRFLDRLGSKIREMKIRSCTHRWEILEQDETLWWAGQGGRFVEFFSGTLSEEKRFPQGVWRKAAKKKCRRCGAYVDEISFGEDWLTAKKDGTLEAKLADGSIFKRAGDVHD